MDGLRAAAREAGIDLVGVTSAEPFEGDDWWGHEQPRDLLPSARSVVVAGFCTRYEPRVVPSEPGKPRGLFGPYASRVFEQMERHCWDVAIGYLGAGGYAALEAPRVWIKPAVVRAGLGRYGKHAVVITPQLGSMVMFACVVTDAPLVEEPDQPVFETTCGSGCRRCVDACPTGAIAGDYRLDRDKCITNWLWGATAPAELRVHQQARLFGCAACLMACPRNDHVRPRVSYPVPVDTVDDSPELLPLAAGDRGYYDRAMPTFPRRAGLDVMRGNAIVALGNAADPIAVETLAETLRKGDVRMRAYSAWALGRIDTDGSRALLQEAHACEQDSAVAAEIETALRPRP